jgi:hypothetical protein
VRSIEYPNKWKKVAEKSHDKYMEVRKYYKV